MKLLSCLLALFSLFLVSCSEKSVSTPIVLSPANIKIANYLILKDDNQNGVANPGEEIQIKLTLKNLGSQTATSVKILKIEPLSGNIEAQLMYSDYGNINSHQTSSGLVKNDSGTIKAKIKKGIATGEECKIKLEISDLNGTRYYDTLFIVAYKSGAVIKIEKFEIKNDDNKDGILNPGEAFDLNLYIKNYGSESAEKVYIYSSELKSASAIPFARNTDFGDIAPDQILPVSYAGSDCNFHIKTSKNAKANDILIYKFQFRDSKDNSWIDSIKITYK
jgi:hypothetical protein